MDALRLVQAVHGFAGYRWWCCGGGEDKVGVSSNLSASITTDLADKQMQTEGKGGFGEWANRICAF